MINETPEERELLIQLLENSNVPMKSARIALSILDKLKVKK